jgi:transcription-repair coupling factor (superfamily II helicase)
MSMRQVGGSQDILSGYAEAVVTRLEGRGEVLHLAGLFGASKALMLSQIGRRAGRSILILTSSSAEAESLARDLQFFSEGPVGYLPEREDEPDVGLRRITCLAGLARKELPLAVASVRAALERLAPPSVLLGAATSLRVRQIMPRDALVRTLETGGYRRVSQVTERGEYSVRGNLLDLFPPQGESPVRAEYFGDELLALREFDPSSQRSIRAAQELLVLPVVETPRLTAAGDEARGAFGADLSAYLPPDAIWTLVDPEGLKAVACSRAGGSGLDWEAFESMMSVRSRILMDEFPRADAEGPGSSIEVRVATIPAYRGRLRELARDLRGWQSDRCRVHLVCRSEAQARRLQEVLGEHDLIASLAEETARPGAIAIVSGDLSGGFHLPQIGLTYVTDNEMFGLRHVPHRRLRPREGTPFDSHHELAFGDYVVHLDHGIGVYKGLRQVSAAGMQGDYLLLVYADNAKLYVPASKLQLVHRYLGADGNAPALDRLGGASWSRAKERVRASIREMARELLTLYAARQVIGGHAFPPDTPWQREFEAAFPYEETPGQRQAIRDVKADMERDRPMDRLVCGDVGYGKTEVAMRAAFKAVMGGKQVAVLVPTTVLALQHVQTFSARFEGFPINVEMLSRFRSRSEQVEVVRGLRDGTVDIVIGTHRILQRDVRFRDLGLLVVDEEHRFGVAAKERLKQLRRQVDVLTLSATPIPRTLHMAMLAVRDISTIETPPAERLSIKTTIARFNPVVIQQAIEAELDRGGRVFFVHNRVESIHSVARLVKRLVPRARLAVAHGELPEARLERIMCDFYAGHSDVLLCTTIIESGLDVGSANTIIVDRADSLGLAQLYQLRGRVGRDKHRAFAYLLVPEDAALSETARKRLQVIAELTELGSGFKVAARDLEIRGAGNLLGPEQHGQIAAVGFDLYSRLIDSTVKELKGEAAMEPVEPSITLEAEGYLPDTYVEDPDVRLQLYKRLTSLAVIEDIPAFREELIDRFGRLPEQAERLLQALTLRIMARALGARELKATGDTIRIAFGSSPSLVAEKVAALVQAERERARYLPTDTLEYRADGDGLIPSALALLSRLLECR